MMTSHPREIRETALKILYQIDLRAEEDPQRVQWVSDNEQQERETQEQARDLALRAWRTHAEADALASELAPAWPTSRQPVVDRSIVRLAYYEFSSGRIPVKVVINEAVELSKLYGSERSPAFINGVLDKMMHRQAGRANSD